MDRQGAELVVALVGQPNCGKSTIFNAAAGFKVATGNFPGTTVSFTETKVHIAGQTIRLIDLPGTYSISSLDLAEKVARDFLLSGRADVVINVLDSSLLSRSLELTLQLIEMNVPLVIALNMTDEAARKGIEIDAGALRALTGVEAIFVVGVKGTGIRELFDAALAAAGRDFSPVMPVYDRDVEECIAEIGARYSDGLAGAFPIAKRFAIIRLLEADLEFERRADEAEPAFMAFVRQKRRLLAEMHNWPEASVFSSHRHAVVLDLFEKVVKVKPRGRKGVGELLDDVIINPLGGAVFILAVLLFTFYAAFRGGDIVSGMVGPPLAALGRSIRGVVPGAASALVGGLYDGLVAGAGIVLPYLIPLLFLLAVLEDTGLLPRIAFMVDGLLHRFGLHGKSVVPIILACGCNVPAVMAARNLENRRDRTIAMLIVPFVACSARTVVVLALAGKYLGAFWTAAVYVGDMAVALAVAFVLSRFKVDLTAGLIMDVPPLRRPYISILVKKVWLRLREFLVFAWPVLIAASVALAALSAAGIDAPINRLLSPVTTGVLRLPEGLGIALFLGFFRKELVLVLLYEALGTADVSTVLSGAQILTLVVFTVLYIPCAATISTLWKEGGLKIAASSAALNLVVSLVVAGAAARVAAACGMS